MQGSNEIHPAVVADDFESVVLVARRVALRVARNRLPRRLVEDAVQEALLRAFKARHTFQGSSFEGWIGRIAANACHDLLPRESRQSGLDPLKRLRNVDIDEDCADEVTSLGSPETDPDLFVGDLVPDAVDEVLSAELCDKMAREAVLSLDGAGLIRPREDQGAITQHVADATERVFGALDAGADVPCGPLLVELGRQAAWGSFGAKDITHAANIERLRLRPVSTLAVVGVGAALLPAGATSADGVRKMLAEHLDAIEIRISDDITALDRERRRGHAAAAAGERLSRACSLLGRLRPSSGVLEGCPEPLDETRPLPGLVREAFHAIDAAERESVGSDQVQSHEIETWADDPSQGAFAR